MIKFILNGGPFMYVLLINIVVILDLVVIKIRDLYIRPKSDIYQIKCGLDGILFWGLVALVNGIFGQLMGIWSALRIIAVATEVSPQVIMQGIIISFNTTLTGFWILIFSALFWYVLRTKADKMINNLK